MTKFEKLGTSAKPPDSPSLSFADIMEDQSEPPESERHLQARGAATKKQQQHHEKKKVQPSQDKPTDRGAKSHEREHAHQKNQPRARESKCHSSHPTGIDVSSHNGTIDWKKVRAAHIDFVFIKATEGATFTDLTFQHNWNSSRKAGMTRGAYHFFRPEKPVHDQVKNFMAAVKYLKPGDLPPVLDVECPRLWKGLTQKQSADRVVHWLSHTQRRLGVAPILYTNRNFLNDVLGNDPRLAKYPLWLAEYRQVPVDSPEPYQCRTFWQQSDCARVAGVGGPVDWNVFNGSHTQFHRLLKPAHKHAQQKGRK